MVKLQKKHRETLVQKMFSKRVNFYRANTQINLDKHLQNLIDRGADEEDIQNYLARKRITIEAWVRGQNILEESVLSHAEWMTADLTKMQSLLEGVGFNVDEEALLIYLEEEGFTDLEIDKEDGTFFEHEEKFETV